MNIFYALGSVARRYGMHIRSTGQHFVRTNADQLAGSLSFISILALVPLLTLVLAILSAYPELSRLSSFLLKYVQNELLPTTGSEEIINHLFSFSQSARRLSAVGLLFLLITSLLLLNRIENALNQIWGISKPRQFSDRVINYWVALTIGPIAVGGVFYLTYESMTYAYGNLGLSPSLTGVFISKSVSLFLLTSLLAFGYVALPNRRVPWRYGMVGAILATIAIALLQKSFEMYLLFFPSYALIYGAFATLPIFLIWVYLCWLTFLFGACWVVQLVRSDYTQGDQNAERDVLRQSEWMVRLVDQLWQQYQKKPQPLEDRGSKKRPSSSLHALLDIFQIWIARRKKGVAGSVNALAQQCCIPTEAAVSLLEKMQGVGWVAYTSDEIWVLSKHPENISMQECRALLFADSEQYAGQNGGEWLAQFYQAGNLLEFLQRQRS